MSGAQGRFDGGQVRERIIRTRVNAALADLPPAVRKLRYDEEYKRQTELYNQERKEKRREAHRVSPALNWERRAGEPPNAYPAHHLLSTVFGCDINPVQHCFSAVLGEREKRIFAKNERSFRL